MWSAGAPVSVKLGIGETRAHAQSRGIHLLPKAVLLALEGKGYDRGNTSERYYA